MQLFWHDLLYLINNQLNVGDEHVYIMSPFITAGILPKILPEGLPATIITSWSPDFIIKNPNSINVYQECKNRLGTALYLNNRLHTKLYATDLTKKKNSAIVGSMNLTRKGLGLDSKPNHEIACLVENLGTNPRIYFQRVLNASILVTDDIFEKYINWLANINYSGEIMDEPISDVDKDAQFIVTDLPLTDSPTRLWDLKSNSAEFEWWEEDSLVHDLAIFGGENAESKELFLHDIRDGFLNHLFIKEFLNIVDEEGIYFGKIKEWIQRNCHDVPTPKRRELTVTVQALLKWTAELLPDQFKVTRPNYSECLRRVY